MEVATKKCKSIYLIFLPNLSCYECPSQKKLRCLDALRGNNLSKTFFVISNLLVNQTFKVANVSTKILILINLYIHHLTNFG
jgi:hypothetical protein